MRIDVVTIFPEFFSVLDVSLIGKARTAGTLDVTAHDLRDFTHDRHRTVDDTPYGGGAGMVMRPEPWGEALDALLPADGDAVLIVPSPAGELFRQGPDAVRGHPRHAEREHANQQACERLGGLAPVLGEHPGEEGLDHLGAQRTAHPGAVEPFAQ